MTTVHTINSVLRASTAKVQTVYRGKYPSRLRAISIGKGETHITSNDHRVLHVIGDDHRALVKALNHQMPTLADTIEVLAQHVADYRNAMQAGRTTGRIAHHIKLQIGLFAPSIVSDKDMMDNELKMSYAVIAAHGSILGHFATVHESSEAYRKARNSAWEAAKNDRAVTSCQIYNLTGIDIYKAKPVKIGPVARAVMSAIDHCLSFGSARPDWVLMNREQSSSAFNVTAMAEAAGVDCLTTAAGNIVSRCDDAQRADEGVALPGHSQPDGVYSVAVYHVERCYGGSEEGGWYYDRGEPSEEFALHLRMFSRVKAAVAYAAQLDATICGEANHGRRPLSSVLSDGRYRAMVQDGYPAAFPSVRPHYE